MGKFVSEIVHRDLFSIKLKISIPPSRFLTGVAVHHGHADDHFLLPADRRVHSDHFADGAADRQVLDGRHDPRHAQRRRRRHHHQLVLPGKGSMVQNNQESRQ